MEKNPTFLLQYRENVEFDRAPKVQWQGNINLKFNNKRFAKVKLTKIICFKNLQRGWGNFL